MDLLLRRVNPVVPGGDGEAAEEMAVLPSVWETGWVQVCRAPPSSLGASRSAENQATELFSLLHLCLFCKASPKALSKKQTTAEPLCFSVWQQPRGCWLMGERKEIYSQNPLTNFSSQMFFFQCLFYFGNWLNRLLSEWCSWWSLVSFRFFCSSLSSDLMISASSSAIFSTGKGSQELSRAAFGFSLPQWGHGFEFLSFSQLLVLKKSWNNIIFKVSLPLQIL